MHNGISFLSVVCNQLHCTVHNCNLYKPFSNCQNKILCGHGVFLTNVTCSVKIKILVGVVLCGFIKVGDLNGGAQYLTEKRLTATVVLATSIDCILVP